MMGSDAGDAGSLLIGDGRVVPIHPLEDAGSPVAICTDEDRAACGCLGQYRRCDTCADPCPASFFCDSTQGVCVPSANRESCATNSSYFCPNGAPCAGPSANATGYCMTTEYCDELPGASPAVSGAVCRFFDGTSYASVATAETCPPVIDPLAPYCGGPCGDESLRCPVTQSCVGLNAGRAVGFCAGLGVCSQASMDLLSTCQTIYGECSCLVMDGHTSGYVASKLLCKDYQARYPGTVDCRDSAWNPQP